MSSTLSVPPAWSIMAVVATVLAVGYPFLLGGIARKKLAVGWKYFWFGALVFLVFQVLTRLPLIAVLQNTVLAPFLRSLTAFTWIWLVVLAVTAGLFEEVGRYVGYRLFMRREPKTWSKAVMFGLGHEGLESIVLVVGGGPILTLLNMVILSATNVSSLSAAQRQAVLHLFTTINAQPIWLPLLAFWERFWSFPLQVMLSVIVLQVFLWHQRRWLFLAILLHALIDFLSSALPQAFGSSMPIKLLDEGMLCVFGLIGVWIIWRLREKDVQVRTEEEVTSL
jgi:uncharacterized membrane protein YhfC